MPFTGHLICILIIGVLIYIMRSIEDQEKPAFLTYLSLSPIAFLKNPVIKIKINLSDNRVVVFYNARLYFFDVKDDKVALVGILAIKADNRTGSVISDLKL